MNYAFEFKTSASGKAKSYHFHQEGASESAARDSLVKDLEDLASQATSLKVSDRPAPASAPAEDSGSGSTGVEVNERMPKGELETIAAAEGVSLKGKRSRAAIVEAILAARAG